MGQSNRKLLKIKKMKIVVVVIIINYAFILRLKLCTCSPVWEEISAQPPLYMNHWHVIVTRESLRYSCMNTSDKYEVAGKKQNRVLHTRVRFLVGMFYHSANILDRGNTYIWHMRNVESTRISFFRVCLCH